MEDWESGGVCGGVVMLLFRRHAREQGIAGWVCFEVGVEAQHQSFGFLRMKKGDGFAEWARSNLEIGGAVAAEHFVTCTGVQDILVASFFAWKKQQVMQGGNLAMRSEKAPKRETVLAHIKDAHKPKNE